MDQRFTVTRVSDFLGRSVNQNSFHYRLLQLMEKAEFTVCLAQKNQPVNLERLIPGWIDDNIIHLFYRAEELLDGIPFMSRHSSNNSHYGSVFTLNLTEVVYKLESLLARRKQELIIPTQAFGSEHLIGSSWPVGRNEEIGMIVDFLSSQQQPQQNNISVVAIIGEPGIGKTTLANFAYRHPKLGGVFDVKAYVRAGDLSNLKAVRKSIRLSLGPQRLRGERFLLVLDGLGNKGNVDWECLLAPLSVGAKGSKVIVTTRFTRVASTMSATLSVPLKPLSYENGLRLFSNCALRYRRDNDPIPVDIGMEIVNNCKGCPLNIKILCSLVYATRMVPIWKAISDGSIWELLHNKDLWRNYSRLSGPHKRCFSYCAIFPKAYRIDRKQLVLMWIAGNFFHSKMTLDLMKEEGDHCVRTLLSESFLQELDESYITMSDSMHDLAQVVGRDFIARDEPQSAPEFSVKARHVSCYAAYFDETTIRKTLGNAKCLRSFLMLCDIDNANVEDRFFLNNRVTTELIPHLYYLRVLSLSGYGISELPDTIGKLKLLRYLDVSRTKIKNLPESVSTMYNLQTLLLSGCDCLEWLPKDMWKLTFLWHLDITGTTSLLEMPMNMTKLENLQTLTSFVVGKSSGSNITELRTLHRICGKFALRRLQNVATPTDALHTNLSRKLGINVLALEFDFEDNEDDVKDGQVQLLENLRPHRNLKELSIVNYSGRKFPHWLDQAYRSMTVLRLSGCRYCHFLPPLGQLPSLKQLEIEGLDNVTTVGPEFYGHKNPTPFKVLESLSFQNMKGWEVWSNVDAKGRVVFFPVLRKLVLHDCPRLKGSLPIQSPFPEEISIHGCVELEALLSQVAPMHTEEVQDMHGISISRSPTNVTPRIPAAVSEAGQSGKIVAMPEVVSSSFNTHILTQEEADPVEQMQISRGLQVGLEISVEPDISAPVTISGTDDIIGLDESMIHQDYFLTTSERAPTPSVAVTEPKGKMIMQEDVTDGLECEFDELLAPRIPVAVSEAGQSSKTVAIPEDMSVSSETYFLTPEEEAVEVAEQMHISQGLQVGLKTPVEPNISASASISGPQMSVSLSELAGPSDGTVAKPEMISTLSEANIPLQVEGILGNTVQSLPKVNTERPIGATVEKILAAFRNKSRRICLYGRGGSGKSTVLRTLSHHPDPKHLFDQIVFVSIPRFDRRRKMQSQIAQQLSLNIEESSSEEETATQICMAFKGRRRKILLLLDDVLETMNLHEIGIPTGRNDGCWLVFTTRYLDFSTDVESREIEMEVLSTVEALELLRYQVGEIVDSPEFESCAQNIAEECHGLPLIIIAVASALKMESSVTEWKLALSMFSDSSNSSNLFPASPHIKYCYDRLKDDGAKTCFLYCALFASDKEIDISVLVCHFLDEGLLGERTAAACKKGNDIVRHLVNVSLLEALANGCKVKMHNTIRDSALVILSSSTEGYKLMTGLYLRASTVPKSCMMSPNIDKYLTGAYAQLKGALPLEEWAEAEMIFLMDNGLSRLPSNPRCPTLTALLLQRNSCLRVIPTSFFDSMDALKILNLSMTRIDCFPDSFSKLKSLQVLILRDCERLLSLPPSIGCLKALEVLDMQGTELTHLPDSVGELSELKKLRVSLYGSVYHRECCKLPSKLIGNGVISRLINLRDLGIFVHPGDQRWTSEVTNVIEEISNLELSALYFHFPGEEHLDNFLRGNPSWKAGHLVTFNFIVGHDFKHAVSQVSYDAEMTHNGEKRGLRFVNGESTLKLLSGVTSFYLDHHLTIRNLSEFGINVVNTLKICILRDCPEIRVIVDQNFVFPVLEYLSINYLWNLEKIWDGQVTPGTLTKLRYLSLKACRKLRYVLTCSMLDFLHNLEELLIEDCASLDYIVIEDETAISNDYNEISGTVLVKNY